MPIRFNNIPLNEPFFIISVLIPVGYFLIPIISYIFNYNMI
jgi:hypothetical protein